MSDSTWNDKEKHSFEWEKRHRRRILALQKRLVEIILSKIAETVTIDSGIIQDGENVQISTILRDVFKDFSKDNEDTVRQLIKEMMQSSSLNADYFKAVGYSENRFESAQSRAKKFVLKSLGLVQRGRVYEVVRDGFIDTIAGNGSTRDVVTRIITESIIGNDGFSQLSKRLKQAVLGGDGTGLIEKHYNLYAFDTLQQVDRVESKIYAEELGLKAFIYSGNVIDNTRCFCKDRVGEVFLTSEAKKWKKLTGKKCGPTSKVGYSPLRDLGGYNCRHNVRYISPSLAVRRRTDLYIDENGNLKKRKA